MKKILFSLLVCLLAVAELQAQTIQSGSKWWDGAVLYTATVNQYGTVLMNGVDESGARYKFQLSKVVNKPGEYVLSADAPDAVLPVRGEIGWRAQYIRQDGMYFLAIRKPNGDICDKMTLTPDNLKDCLAQERWAENEMAVSDALQHWLMNKHYLGHFSKDALRLMRNEILARHGWKFQSKDLQVYFGSQDWYKPGTDNSAIKLSIIEQTNIQLIKSEETVPDYLRAYNNYGQGYPGGLDDDGRGPDEVGGNEYVVTTELQFLKALGSNRTVIVGEDIHLNLSRVLENEEYFVGVKGRRWVGDASSLAGSVPLVVSESETDGRQLALLNFKGLVIKGERNSSIEVDPRYSYCLYFINCENCEVVNLTIGHTEGGYCSGGVIGIKGGRMNVVRDCDLYGCGTYGVDLMTTTDFGMLKTKVHDCTYGIMQLSSCVAVQFTDCDFFNNREFTLVEGWGNQGVSFQGCRFFANWGDAPLFRLENTFYMADCEIYHPTENLGSIEKADQSGKKNKFSPNPLDSNIKSRNIGPDIK